MPDCATPRHHDTPTDAGNAYLCRPCQRQLARDIHRTPTLDHQLEHILTTHRPGSRGDGTGLPYNDPAAEVRSQIRHDIAWWARRCATEREVALPPRPTLAALCGWLGGEGMASPPRPWIPYQPWAADLAGAMADNRSRALALLDPWVRKTFPLPLPDGACLQCPGRMWVMVYASDGDRRRSYVACDQCGAKWEPEQWMRLGQRIIHRREEATALPATMASHGRLRHGRRSRPHLPCPPRHDPLLGIARPVAPHPHQTRPLPQGRRTNLLGQKTHPTQLAYAVTCVQPSAP